MTRTPKHRWRVWFRDGTSRDVYATTAVNAKRTAEYAQKLVGYRKDAARAVDAKDMGHVGTDAADCKLCRQPKLFPIVEETA